MFIPHRMAVVRYILISIGCLGLNLAGEYTKHHLMVCGGASVRDIHATRRGGARTHQSWDEVLPDAERCRDEMEDETKYGS